MRDAAIARERHCRQVGLTAEVGVASQRGTPVGVGERPCVRALVGGGLREN